MLVHRVVTGLLVALVAVAVALPALPGSVAAADWNVALVNGRPADRSGVIVCVDGRNLGWAGNGGGVVRASLTVGTHRARFYKGVDDGSKCGTGTLTGRTAFTVAPYEWLAIVLANGSSVDRVTRVLHQDLTYGETFNQVTIWNATRQSFVIAMASASIVAPAAEAPIMRPGDTWRSTYYEPLSITLTAYGFNGRGELLDYPVYWKTRLTRIGWSHLVIAADTDFVVLRMPNLPLVIG